VADARPVALIGATGHFPVPAYLPALVRPVLPWTRRHVARVAACYAASQTELWDAALTALIRAAVYFREQPPGEYQATVYARPLPAVRSFTYYARLAVNRACWRYVIRGQATQVRTVPLDDAGDPRVPDALTSPSAEDTAIAREAARRAWILREHAALADARGDSDTASRLRAAGSAADRRARCTRRRSPQSSRSA
jgi:hypothetical protein